MAWVYKGGSEQTTGLLEHRPFGQTRPNRPGSHSVDHELLCGPKYSRIKLETICLTSKATGRWLKVQQWLKKKRIKVKVQTLQQNLDFERSPFGDVWPIMHSATFGEHQTPNTVSAIRHGGGDVLIWACFAVTGRGQLLSQLQTLLFIKYY